MLRARRCFGSREHRGVVGRTVNAWRDSMSDSNQFQRLLDDPAIALVEWRERGETRGRFSVGRRVAIDATHSAIIGPDAPAFVVEPGGHLTIKGGLVSTTSFDCASKCAGATESWRRGPSVEVRQGGSVSFDGTDIIGDVVGASDLAGEWHLPLVLRLADMPSRSRGVVLVRGFVPYEVEVSSEIYSVGPTVRSIGPGPVQLELDIDARDAEGGVLIDGWIRFSAKGAVRRTRLRVRMSASARPIPNGPLWEAEAFSRPPRPLIQSPPSPPAATPPAVPPASIPAGARANRGGLSPIFEPSRPVGATPSRGGSASLPTAIPAGPDTTPPTPIPNTSGGSRWDQLVAGRPRSTGSGVSGIFQPKPSGTPVRQDSPETHASSRVDATMTDGGACVAPQQRIVGCSEGSASNEIAGADRPADPSGSKRGSVSPIFRKRSDKPGA